VGAVSRAISDTKEGEVLGVRGPFGTGWGVEAAEGSDIVIAGGGIGLAPLRPVIQTVLANREHYGRVTILVGARSPDLLLFQYDLPVWGASTEVDVLVTVDSAGSDWRGNVGLITELISQATFDPATTHAFVCGPEVMMRFVALGLIDRGVSPGEVRVSMERNMKCAIGHCGHCQFGPSFVCRGGPVYPYEEIAKLLAIKEV
ncbi:MAG: FAD/NAD(P)-binding protein, partial [Actinomycetota bacterium]